MYALRPIVIINQIPSEIQFVSYTVRTIKAKFMWTLYIIPGPTARSAVPRVSPGEGTNSAWLFPPGESETLAKSKVHQLSRACVTNHGWSSSLISKIYGCLPDVG
jgi:hypothetical protein